MVTHSSILAWQTPMDRGAWWAAVRGISKSGTLSLLCLCRPQKVESEVDNVTAKILIPPAAFVAVVQCLSHVQLFANP